MSLIKFRALLLLSAMAAGPLVAQAQDAGSASPPPAPANEHTPSTAAGQNQLPAIEVKQPPAPQPKPRAAKRKIPAAPQAAPPPQAVGVETYEPAAADATARATTGAASPNNPAKGIVPDDLSKFSSAATRVTTADIDANQPRQINDVFDRVPGVHVVNDDGFGRHGGVGLRGSPPRRGRKVLHLEDGLPINMSIWVDPSVHYVPPVDRIESVEVLRGTVLVHGPLNNHGVVNFQNLSPFGPNETVIGASIGDTKQRGGSEGDTSSPYGVSNTRHFHTRQTFDNASAVFSYSGAEADGSWDLERLRYNDFYSALGWKGVDQDFTLSAVYFRQFDNYDEANLTGEDGDGEGAVERRFFDGAGHGKSIFNPGSRFNTYNAEVVRLAATHNYYIDDNTTLTTRLYGQHHRRDRYQNFDGEDPSVEDVGLPAFIDGDDVFVPEGSMLGRLRTYRHLGAEARAELANRPFIGGLKQDIQTGIRYEHHDFTNRNFFGTQGEILDDGDETGTTVFDRDTGVDAVSAFVQTNIHVTNTFKVIPGVRLEHFRVTRDTFALTEEEGEAEEEEDCPQSPDPSDPEECAVLEGFSNDNFSETFTKTHVLPGVAFAWSGIYRSTVYGGYHRGLTTGVLREAAFPPGDELGDNFQLGLRSTAFRGLTFEVAAFHNRIQDFQIKGSATNAVGNNIYSNVDRVEINGVEMFGRIDTQPLMGGVWNPYVEGTYTLSDSIIKDGVNDEGDSLAGNEVPEVPTHVAHLTLGLQHASGWDISASYMYRSAFFTDEENTAFGKDEEGEDGEVPSVWLLSARANYKIAGTGASVFIAGDNLTDELYISDREDGIKAGQGRTIWTGFKYKFN